MPQGKNVKLAVEQATKAKRAGRYKALFFFNLSAKWGRWLMPLT
jgi:hypothetical protein